MKKNTGYVSGIIVTGENRIKIQTRVEFLILDCASYARELLISQEDRIAELQDSNEEIHRRTALFLRRTTNELRHWLTTRRGSTPSIRPLARRIELQNYQVSARDLRAYLALVLSLSRGADAEDVPKFVFHADLPSPVLFVTRPLRLLAAHCGLDTLGVVESEEELAARVELATADWSLRQ